MRTLQSACFRCSLQECGLVNRVKNYFNQADERIRHNWRSAIAARLSFLHYTLFSECFIGCTFLMLFLKSKLKRDYKLYDTGSEPMVNSFNFLGLKAIKEIGKKEIGKKKIGKKK